MVGSILLVIPVIVCGGLGAVVGYVYRYRVQLRRVFTLIAPILVLLLFEITSGTLSSKYTLRENITEQLDLLAPFTFLYLLPAVFTSFFVARRWRAWW